MLAAGLFTLMIFLSFFYYICVRIKLMKLAVEMDVKSTTPSDFCLMGSNMYFDKHDSKSIEEAIKKELKEGYEVDIEYVNVAYDIADFFKVVDEFAKLKKYKFIIEAYMKKNKMSKEEFQELTLTKELAKELPTE